MTGAEYSPTLQAALALDPGGLRPSVARGLESWGVGAVFFDIGGRPQAVSCDRDRSQEVRLHVIGGTGEIGDASGSPRRASARVRACPLPYCRIGHLSATDRRLAHFRDVGGLWVRLVTAPHGRTGRLRVRTIRFERIVAKAA